MTEFLNFESDYKQSPQEIVFQANLLWNFSWRWLSSTFTLAARLNCVSRHALGILTCSDWANRLELSWGTSEFGLWLQAITTRNRLSSRAPLKFLMRIIIIYFWSACPVEFCPQDMHWVDWDAQIEPTGWNHHDRIFNFESDYKQSPQEIVFQSNLLWNFSWRWLSSTFTVPARLNYVSKHALGILTCSDCANRLELSWGKSEFGLWYKQSPQEIIFFKRTSSEISHEDHHHLLLKCLPGWILSPYMHWVVWHAQMGPTGWNYHDQICILNLITSNHHKKSSFKVIACNQTQN